MLVFLRLDLRLLLPRPLLLSFSVFGILNSSLLCCLFSRERLPSKTHQGFLDRLLLGQWMVCRYGFTRRRRWGHSRYGFLGGNGAFLFLCSLVRLGIAADFDDRLVLPSTFPTGSGTFRQ